MSLGNALLTGRNYIALEDIPIVVKTVLSTAIIDRVGLVRLLMTKGGTATTADVAGALKVTNKTALRNMTELMVIGLVDIKDEDVSASYNNPPFKPKRITLKEEFQWLLSEDFQKLREGFEPVDNRAFMEKKSVIQPKEKTNDSSSLMRQVSIFWQVFVESEDVERRSNPGMNVDNIPIPEEKLLDALVSSGNFIQSDAAMIIEKMKHEEFIEQVGDSGAVRRKVKL